MRLSSCLLLSIKAITRMNSFNLCLEKVNPVTPLTYEQVQKMLSAAGITYTEEDAIEVAYRVNALRQALGDLEHPELDSTEPAFVFPERGN